VINHFENQKKSIYERYRVAERRDDTRALDRLDMEIDKFNERIDKYEGDISPITDKSLKRALEERPEKRILAD
jgi:hypothetical protein